MRIFLSILGAFLILAGSVWFLQGIGVLPGSLMSGQVQWAVYGGIAAALGICLIWWVNRRKRNP